MRVAITLVGSTCQRGVPFDPGLGCTASVALDRRCRSGSARQGTPGAPGLQLLVGWGASVDRRPPGDGEIDPG